ncbi:hypothetical protein [Streptodolium elevatio]
MASVLRFRGRLVFVTLASVLAILLQLAPATAVAARPPNPFASPGSALSLTIGESTFHAGRAPADTWAGCGVSDDKHKLVRTFSKSGGPGGPSAYLRCGSENWGYRHIKARHIQDWENLAAMAGDNWRAFADWAMEQILKVPGSVDYRDSNDTWSFSAPIQIKRADGSVVATYHPLVSVANDSKNIITAYPRH